MQSRHMVIFQETYVSLKGVLKTSLPVLENRLERVFFKTPLVFQDVRSRHLIYFQEIIDSIKTHCDFSRDIGVLKRCLEKYFTYLEEPS